MIVFAQLFLHVTSNQANAECCIWQQKSQQASLTSSSLWSQSPVPQPLKLLPPPGASAYRPPMLHKGPPHLKFEPLHSGSALAAALSTLPVPEVDSHCRVATPVHFASLTDASTQTNMEILPINSQKSPENSKKSTKKSEKSEKSLENFGNTSYGNIEDPTLYLLALALHFSKERKIDLAMTGGVRALLGVD